LRKATADDRCVSTIVRQPLPAFSESSRGPRPTRTV
jgi:hypothetical protein